ncbi:MAG: histone deacetylase family protein [Oceanicaulis sp.]|nr:histone deacetylase family protein [Oceanicaulis sp.]
MRTLVHAPAAGLSHHPPAGHPEHAGRLEAVLRAVTAAGLTARTEFSPAGRAALERVHVPGLINQVFAASPDEGETALDADTWMSPGSLEAALTAAGAGMAGVDAVMAGEAEAVFVAARPPGHHAEPGRAMGFCLFNTVAIAAAHALSHHGLARVAVIDIDVHHGNGTQAWAEQEPACLFASIHQGWIYPGTGAAHETGRHGNIINTPMPAGTAGPAWRRAVEHSILTRLDAFEPDMVLVSAGFDAHRDDPLAGLSLDDEDYAWAGGALAAAARRHANSRLVCVLEGGYDCAALERSAKAFLSALQTA